MQVPEKLYQDGLNCLQQGDTEKAARLFEEASGKDHIDAMYILADMHARKARYNFSGANPEEAVRLYKILINEHNDDMSKFHLGVMYCNGEKIQWNPEEGSKLVSEFEEAIKGNNNLPFGVYSELGDIYTAGKLRRVGDSWDSKNATVDDLEKAINYLTKAVEVADDKIHPEWLNLIKEQLALSIKRLEQTKEIDGMLVEIKRGFGGV
jgi:TPR repeat protein